MAQLNFDSIPVDENSGNNGGGNQVGFFTLKNDGDKAYVRFMHDSTQTFDVQSVHSITVDGKYRKVSCLREDGNAPLDNCPLCKAGVQTQNRFFIHLLQYTQNASGQIVVEPKVWERSMKYAYDLKEKLMNYGPLSDVVFQVTRHGKAGDMQTTYSIDYMPNLQDPNTYPKRPELFDGYSALGTIVMDKTFEEVNAFVATGTFPPRQNGNTSAPATTMPQQPVYQQAAPQQFTPPTGQPAFAPQQPQAPFAPQQMAQAPFATQQAPFGGAPVNTAPFNNNASTPPWETPQVTPMQAPIRSY